LSALERGHQVQDKLEQDDFGQWFLDIRIAHARVCCHAALDDFQAESVRVLSPVLFVLGADRDGARISFAVDWIEFFHI